MADQQRPIRILSIDGGGIRGILPARVLEALEMRSKRKATELFDVIAGTSTGGIIGCGLLAGFSAAELGDLYAKRGGEIFDRSLWRKATTLGSIAGPKYAADALEAIVKELLGDKWLGDVAGPALLIPSYCIELPRAEPADGIDFVTTRRPYFFRSWKARGEKLKPGESARDCDFLLRDVARATSAAPTYFPPAQIENRTGDSFAFVDGGLFANNPALCALAAAYELYGPDRRYIVVSLGTGSLERPIPYKDAKGWGDIGWLHQVLSILMDGNADTVCHQLDEVLGKDHFRFEITTGVNHDDPTAVDEDFDDATPDNIARMERLANRLIQSSGEKLLTLTDLLAPPQPVPVA